MDRLFVFAAEFLKRLHSDRDFSSLTKVRLVVEAGDLWNQALEAVFTFRVEHAASYGILPELLNEGVLTDAVEYADLPEFWTSSNVMQKAAVAMCDYSRLLASGEYEVNEQDADLGALVRQVLPEIPRLIQLMCLIYQERIRWLMARQDDASREIGSELQAKYDTARAKQIRALADLAQSEAGMRLAEKYRDMDTLTDMIFAEVQWSYEELDKNPPDKAAIIKHADAMTARIGKYFRQIRRRLGRCVLRQDLPRANGRPDVQRCSATLAEAAHQMAPR